MIRNCGSCSNPADVVYFPGNVKNGVAYCAKHFPKNIHHLFNTEFVVPAGRLNKSPEPVVVPEPVVSEEPKKKSKKNTVDAPIEETPAETPVEEIVEELPAPEQPVEE